MPRCLELGAPIFLLVRAGTGGIPRPSVFILPTQITYFNFIIYIWLGHSAVGYLLNRSSFPNAVEFVAWIARSRDTIVRKSLLTTFMRLQVLHGSPAQNLLLPVRLLLRRSELN